jgi:hypothetical protein
MHFAGMSSYHDLRVRFQEAALPREHATERCAVTGAAVVRDKAGHRNAALQVQKGEALAEVKQEVILDRGRGKTRFVSLVVDPSPIELTFSVSRDDSQSPDLSRGHRQ